MRRARLQLCAGAVCLALAAVSAGVQAQTQLQDPPATGAHASSDPAPGNAAAGVPAQILVTGRRPGPGLWKVSKDGHVMWVFGTYAPLPKDMEWDAGRVENLIVRSQALMLQPSGNAHFRFYQAFSLLPALPSLFGIRKNPDGAMLQDVLPPETYAQWTALKARYIGQDDDVDRLRPLFAGEQLMRAARIKNGLATRDTLQDQIVQIARKNKVKVVPTGFQIPTTDISKKIKEFKQTRLNDVACFARTLDSLEEDIDAMRARANAWAKGNIAEIGKLDFAKREACVEELLKSSVTSDIEALQGFRGRLHDAWMAAAEKALAENTSTFAVLAMEDIVGPQSYLAELQARGYTVESPK